jgi:16S rRNA A1518/A1519 N6-dimethyltransferase RsmA/KsgA/DIM1 with predicted DNA glycosylase/AP lyase activity
MLAPFIPTPEEVIKEMLDCANAGRNDILIDLGSGDGRILKIAKEYFHVKLAIGVELNKVLCKESKSEDIEIICGDLLSLSEVLIPKATIITIYLSPRSNKLLEDIILKNGKKGLKIISHDFEFSKLSLEKIKKIKTMGLLGLTKHTIYCYKL